MSSGTPFDTETDFTVPIKRHSPQFDGMRTRIASKNNCFISVVWRGASHPQLLTNFRNLEYDSFKCDVIYPPEESMVRTEFRYGNIESWSVYDGSIGEL